MSLSPPAILPTTATASPSSAVDGHAEGQLEALDATFRLVDAALGVGATAARVLVSDRNGRLHLASHRGGLVDVGVRRSLRRRAFVAGRSDVVTLRRPQDVELAVVPLIRKGAAVGVLEVAAPAPLATERLRLLEAIADQTAIMLANVADVEDGRRIVDATERVGGLLASLTTASSKEEALSAVVRELWQALGVPVAAWLHVPDAGIELVATRGVGRDLRSSLVVSSDEAWDATAVAARARGILGEVTTIVTTSGDALVASCTPSSHDADALFEAIGGALSLALERLHLRDVVRGLPASLDAGLTWTAHEIRDPLLAVEKALEMVIPEHLDDDGRELLRGAQRDVRRLATTVDELLRWSAGVVAIRPRPTDLTRVVHEVVESLPKEHGDRTISLELPETAVVRGDPLLLSVGISNLVRNALEHGEGDIEIAVDATEQHAVVSVADRGPGVLEDEISAVFQPFFRGSRAGRRGQGLGLFIARRAVEAHGGELWFGAAGARPVVQMRIPAGAA